MALAAFLKLQEQEEGDFKTSGGDSVALAATALALVAFVIAFLYELIKSRMAKEPEVPLQEWMKQRVLDFRAAVADDQPTLKPCRRFTSLALSVVSGLAVLVSAQLRPSQEEEAKQGETSLGPAESVIFVLGLLSYLVSLILAIGAKKRARLSIIGSSIQRGACWNIVEIILRLADIGAGLLGVVVMSSKRHYCSTAALLQVTHGSYLCSPDIQEPQPRARLHR